MTMTSQDRNWISIAEQASLEMDPAQLAILVKRLCRALDDRGTCAGDETKRELSKPSHPVPCPWHTAGSD
jgi:hypothetical protein